jgi:hypothetical protein
MAKDIIVKNQEVRKFGRQFLPRERIKSFENDIQTPISNDEQHKQFEVFSNPSSKNIRTSDFTHPY